MTTPVDRSRSMKKGPTKSHSSDSESRSSNSTRSSNVSSHYEDVLEYKKVDPNGPGMEKPLAKAIGFDLYSTVATTLEPNEVYILPTNIIVTSMPRGTYGRIACRSGLAAKGMSISGGVIDEDFRGEIKCIVSTLKPIEITLETRIAQLILERAINCESVEMVGPIDETERGTQGFGSSG